MKKFYHLSDTWIEPSLTVFPKVIRVDDPTDPRDLEPCVAVAPSPLQCIIALGAWRDAPIVSVYRTNYDAIPATWIFDYGVTQEHRIYEPVVFEKIGEIDLPHFASILPYRNTCGVSDTQILKNIKQDMVELQQLLFSC